MAKMFTNRKIIILLVLIFPILSSAQHAGIKDKINLYLIEGKYEAIIKEFGNQQNNANFDILYGLGLAYRSLYKHGEAVNVLHKANNLDKTNIEVLINLGRSYMELGDDSSAEKIFHKALNLDPYNQSASINLGKIYMNLRRYHEAEKIFTTLTNLDPVNAYFVKNLGICELKTNDLTKAALHFRKAININKKDAVIFYYLSDIYSKIKDDSLALHILNEGLLNNPDNYFLLKAKAEKLFRNERFDEAIENYDKVYAAGDSTASILKKMGICYYFLMNKASSLYTLTKSIEKDSTDGQSYYYLGLTYERLSMYPEAINCLNQAQNKLIPVLIPNLYFQLAGNYDNNGNYPEAIRYYKKSLDSSPDMIISLLYLATVYEKYYADPNTALEYYKRFLDESPNADPKFIDYSEQRIEKLIEKVHFQK